MTDFDMEEVLYEEVAGEGIEDEKRKKGAGKPGQRPRAAGDRRAGGSTPAAPDTPAPPPAAAPGPRPSPPGAQPAAPVPPSTTERPPSPPPAAQAVGGPDSTPAAADPWGEALLAAEPAPDIDGRVLCPDGACVGVIGPDGRCGECGRKAPGGVPDAPARGDVDGPRAGGDPAGEAEPWETVDDDALEGPPDLDSRILCPDGACIGVVGPDGRCRECGREA